MCLSILRKKKNKKAVGFYIEITTATISRLLLRLNFRESEVEKKKNKIKCEPIDRFHCPCNCVFVFIVHSLSGLYPIPSFLIDCQFQYGGKCFLLFFLFLKKNKLARPESVRK